ncbi:hypothetical protein BV25DRAFT_1922505 [Artomyces pyxidatus]|uniref:Uncharacterized protein n=1 Tax=Artomyces pyxidatus TaxID=48021 RepID=A0ACB8SDN0_9AGAM|nr:hypothetical protein BV25DRAFT_1922505 [Artomyces pyxidatus]
MSRTTRSKRVFSPYTVEDPPAGTSAAFVVAGLDFGVLVEHILEATDAYEANRPHSFPSLTTSKSPDAPSSHPSTRGPSISSAAPTYASSPPSGASHAPSSRAATLITFPARSNAPHALSIAPAAPSSLRAPSHAPFNGREPRDTPPAPRIEACDPHGDAAQARHPAIAIECNAAARRPQAPAPGPPPPSTQRLGPQSHIGATARHHEGAAAYTQHTCPPQQSERTPCAGQPMRRWDGNAADGLGLPGQEARLSLANKHGKLKRQRKKAAATVLTAGRLVDYKMCEGVLHKHTTPKPHNVQMLAVKHPHAKGAWVGKTQRAARGPQGLNDRLVQGYDVLQWDGREWSVAKKFADVRGRMNPSPSETSHQRGKYVALRAGVSYGGGQTPQNMDAGRHATLVQEPLEDPNVQRISGFANSSLAVGAPNLCKHYEENALKVLDCDPTFEFPFNNSVHAAVTFNLGPPTITAAACRQRQPPLRCEFRWARAQELFSTYGTLEDDIRCAFGTGAPQSN